MEVEIIRFCRAVLRNIGDDMPIRMSQFEVLNSMCTCPGPHMPAALADMLGVSKAMISKHISVLLSNGLIVRVPSPEDGRSVYLVPSKRGLDLFKKLSKQSAEKMNALKTQMGPKKFEALVKLIVTANQIIDK